MGYLKEIESKKLFVGIRKDYFNLYYKGASVAKFKIIDEGIVCTTSPQYYKENSHKKGKQISIDEFDLDEVIRGIDEHIKRKNTKEKECQQNLIMANNSPESNSEWFCIDMEYNMEKESSKIANYGRFDIVAVSKNRDNESGKYKVALIELKVGTDSFSGTSEYFKNLTKEKESIKGIINVEDKNNIGSGILGHFSDYVRYLNDSNRYNMLTEELCRILKNYHELELMTFDYKITEADFEKEPVVVFLTYSGKDSSDKNLDVIKVKNSFRRYLLNKKVDGHPCSRINVQDMWDENGKEYIPKFKYVFREGLADSSITPIFNDLIISEAVNIEE